MKSNRSLKYASPIAQIGPWNIQSCMTPGLTFLLKEGLSFIIRSLSFNSNTSFRFYLVSTLKFPKDGEWLQSNKWSRTVPPLGTALRLNFLLSQWQDSDAPQILHWGVLHIHYNRIHSRVHTEVYKQHQMYKFFGMQSLKRKAFINLFRLLNTICNLQQLRIPLRDLTWY